MEKRKEEICSVSQKAFLRPSKNALGRRRGEKKTSLSFPNEKDVAKARAGWSDTNWRESASRGKQWRCERQCREREQASNRQPLGAEAVCPGKEPRAMMDTASCPSDNKPSLFALLRSPMALSKPVVPLSPQPQDSLMARRSRERQAEALNQSTMEMFKALAESSPAAAAIARNSLIETNPRLAWALHGMLSKHHGDEPGASVEATVEELKEEREARSSSRSRDDSPLAGSWVAISAKTALNPSSAARAALKEKDLDANGRTPAQASAKNAFGARTAFRLGLRAISRNERDDAWRRSADRPKSLKEADAAPIDALRAVAANVLRGPFSDGDCMAWLRVVASAGKTRPEQVDLTETPPSEEEKRARARALAAMMENKRFTMPKPTPNEILRREEWLATVRALSTERPAVEDLEFWLREALAAKRPAVARAVADVLKAQGVSREHGFGLHEGLNYGKGRHRGWSDEDFRLDWRISGDKDNETRRRFGDQQFEWLDDELWKTDSAKPAQFFGGRNPRTANTSAFVRAGPFALSMLQGLGWEWLRDAGLAPMPAEMGLIARLAPLEDYKALAEWMAEEFTLARDTQKALEAQEAAQKEAAEKTDAQRHDFQVLPDFAGQWGGWGAGGPPKGALTDDDIANLAPLFGGDREQWRLTARSLERRDSIDGGHRVVAELTRGARGPQDVLDRMRREHQKWRDALARGIKQNAVLRSEKSPPNGAAAWIGWLDEAIAEKSPQPARLPARAIAPFGEDVNFRAAGHNEKFMTAQTQKSFIVEIISRAWLSEWIGPKAWDGFGPKAAPNADGLCFPKEAWEYARNRAKHAQKALLALAEHLAFHPEPDHQRFAIGANALKKAPNLNYWGGPSDTPGHGPLLCALLQGKSSLAADWIASAGNSRLGHAWGIAVNVRQLAANGQFQDKTQTPRPGEPSGDWPRDAEKPPSMKEAHKRELASLGIAGLALLAGAPEVIRAAKRLQKGAIERDVEQLKIWREMVKGKTTSNAAEALDLALSHAEAMELSNIALKKPAKKKAATKKDTPAAPARRRL